MGVTAEDVRCSIINLGPGDARQNADVMRTVVRRNGKLAGVYGAPLRTGTVHIEQDVSLKPSDAI